MSESIIDRQVGVGIENMEQGLILLSIPFVRVYSIHAEQKGLVAHGALNFLEYRQLSLFGLAIGDYKCTLSPQVPVTKAEPLIYLIHDFDGYMGIVLHPDTPCESIDYLDTLLLEHTLFTTQVEPEPLPYTERIGNWLESASESVKNRLISGSTSAGNSLKRGGEIVKAKLAPCEEEKKVPRYVQTSAKGVKSATEFVYTCSQAVSSKAEKGAEFVGKAVAAGYSKLRGQRKPAQRPSGTSVLAAGALKALKNLISGAEESVFILARSARDTTVEVVDHRYGGEVSGVVADGLGSVGNLGSAAHSLTQMTPLSMARNAAEGGLDDPKAKSAPAIPAAESPEAKVPPQ